MLRPRGPRAGGHEVSGEPGAVVELRSIACARPLEEIYGKVID